METEQSFERIGEQLDNIFEKLEKEARERRKEHNHVNRKISSVIQVLAEEERVDIEREDFEEES